MYPYPLIILCVALAILLVLEAGDLIYRRTRALYPFRPGWVECARIRLSSTERAPDVAMLARIVTAFRSNRRWAPEVWVHVKADWGDWALQQGPRRWGLFGKRPTIVEVSARKGDESGALALARALQVVADGDEPTGLASRLQNEIGELKRERMARAQG
jgi:hypothetical protein